MGPTSKKAALFSCAALIALSLGSAAWAAPRNFDVPAQDAVKAIPEFGRQAGVQVVAPADRLKGVRTPTVRGRMEVRDAILLLVKDTGLTVASDDGRVIVLRMQQSAEAPADSDRPAQPDEALDDGDRKVERVVVTGTNIRGKHPKSSPLDVYTAKDIERSGATTTEQFIQKLPQNFGTRTQFASNTDPQNDSTRNRDAVASVDLRGLGVGTTLILMNGRRVGSSDFGQSVDISLIPLAAIERVEVLTDGASAIYGSDAIGGVVNFILRDDYDGAETRTSYGGVTSGDLRQFNASQTVGRSWGSGNALASYNYFDANALERLDRDYASPAGRGTLTPNDVRHNLLLTGSQDVGERLTLGGDFAFTRREIKGEADNLLLGFFGFPEFDSFLTYRSQTDQSFGNLALDYRATETLHASLQASYSKTKVESESSTLFFNFVPPFLSRFQRENDHSNFDVTGMLDGELFELPGGVVRFSLGGGLLDEQYQGTTTLDGEASGRELGRRTTYAFGEIFAPLVAEEQNIPLMHRLELSVAARYTSHKDTSSPALSQDFGDAIDPKIGLYWAPFESLGFRGTYGTSFRAPSLTETDPTGGQNQVEDAVVSGAPAVVVAFVAFPATEMAPETAETFTLGFDFRPADTRFRLSGTYYNIAYTDRIGVAPDAFASDLFTDPSAHSDVIFRAPSADFIEQAFGQAPFASTTVTTLGVICPGVSPSDRGAVATCLYAQPNLYVVDRRTRNLALSEQDGFDLSVSNTFEMAWGEATVGANISRILSYRQQGAPSSPISTQVDNDFGRPTDLRGRGFVSLSRGGFSGTFGVNYVDDYRTRAPSNSIDSWITCDLNLTYDFGDTDSELLNGFQISLSAQNLFDEDPPFLQIDPTVTFRDRIGFDAANANPLGRIVVLGVTKRW